MRICFALPFVLMAMGSAPSVAETLSAPPLPRDFAPRPVFTPSAPPSASGVRGVAPVYPVAITLSLGNETLWSGTLNVGSAGNARITINEPVDGSASCNLKSGYERNNRLIELSLNENRYGEGASRVQLSVRYARPPGGEECGGTRSVAIEQAFEWNGANSRRFDGDGGFRITLTRR